MEFIFLASQSICVTVYVDTCSDRPHLAGRNTKFTSSRSHQSDTIMMIERTVLPSSVAQRKIIQFLTKGSILLKFLPDFKHIVLN